MVTAACFFPMVLIHMMPLSSNTFTKKWAVAHHKQGVWKADSGSQPCTWHRLCAYRGILLAHLWMPGKQGCNVCCMFTCGCLGSKVVTCVGVLLLVHLWCTVVTCVGVLLLVHLWYKAVCSPVGAWGMGCKVVTCVGILVLVHLWMPGGARL
jgi:hypothetical protein